MDQLKPMPARNAISLRGRPWPELFPQRYSFSRKSLPGVPARLPAAEIKPPKACLIMAFLVIIQRCKQAFNNITPETRRNPMIRKMLMVTAMAVLVVSTFTAHAGVNLFSVTRMVVASNVEEREPVGVADSFTPDTGRVYCFIEAQNIQRQTTARTVWYHGAEEVASIKLDLGQGSRWRTFSVVTIGGRTGNWRVDLRDATDRVVQSVDFRVE
jgi:hypothetical protein